MCCSAARQPGQDRSPICRPSANFHTASGPQIERAGDLAGILTNLQERDVLFMIKDHRLHPSVEEYLYPAIEGLPARRIIIDQGPKAHHPARSAALHARGATTRAGKLTPMRSRWAASRTASITTTERRAHPHPLRTPAPVSIEQEGAHEIARRFHVAPRITNHPLGAGLRPREGAKRHHRRSGAPRSPYATLVKADSMKMDARILRSHHRQFDGGPVGMGSVAVAVGEGRQHARRRAQATSSCRLPQAHPRGPRRHARRL